MALYVTITSDRPGEGKTTLGLLLLRLLRDQLAERGGDASIGLRSDGLLGPPTHLRCSHPDMCVTFRGFDERPEVARNRPRDRGALVERLCRRDRQVEIQITEVFGRPAAKKVAARRPPKKKGRA